MKKRLGCMILSASLLLSGISAAALAADSENTVTEYDAELLTEQMLDTYDYVFDGGTFAQQKMASSYLAKSAWVGNYRVLFQNATEYEDIAYGQGTIYSSACGPSALCNALFEARVADVDIPTMCELAVSCGARVSGGTNETTLLEAASSIYGFTYTSTNDAEDLREHLENGGIAIIHAGTSYPLFTTAGHYMAAVDIDGDDVTLLDSYWYEDKYTSTEIRAENVTVLGTGVVQTALDQIVEATADRSPCYYLLYKTSTVKSAEDNGDAPFWDVLETEWYYDYVVEAYDKNLMAGTSPVQFSPTVELTRAMAVQILYNYEIQINEDLVVEETVSYSDVSDSAWYKTAVDWATAAGVTSGVGNNRFAPNESVTREQFATMLYQYLGETETYDGETLSSFPDGDEVSDWAIDGVSWAVENGIISGKLSGETLYLDPLGSATRAEAATILLKYIDLISE